MKSIKGLFSPSIMSAFVYGMGGIGFSLGNVLLARGLPTEEFAIFALIIAFSQISYGLGPLGVDIIANRYPILLSTKLLVRVLINSTVISTILSLVALKAYHLPGPETIILFLFCIGISINKVASSIYQSRQQFGQSLFISQIHNGMITLASIIVLIFDINTAFWPVFILALAYFSTAFWAWRRLFSEMNLKPDELIESPPWKEGWAIVGSVTAVIILIQLERLIIPQFINAASLALFAVLAAIAGSPFRVMQMGISHTLLPRLSSAKIIKDRRTIVFNEARLMFTILIVSIIAVWFLTPFITDWFLDDKYVLGQSLIMAMILAGSAKVFSAFVSSAIEAVGNGSDLVRFNLLSWMTILIAVISAYYGAQEYGLTGLILGVGLGWVLQSLAGISIVYRYFLITHTDQAR